MLKKLFKKKNREEYNYHLMYKDEAFHDGIDLIKQKDFTRAELVVLVSLLGVVLHRGDTENFDKFLQTRKDNFDSARSKVED